MWLLDSVRRALPWARGVEASRGGIAAAMPPVTGRLSPEAEPQPEAEAEPNRLAPRRAAIPGRSRRLVLTTEEHVELFFGFILENATPGSIIDPDEMAELYECFCEYEGVVPRRWNPIAKSLKELMGQGPGGSPKPYHPFLQPDGSYEKRRAWYVPDRRPARRQPEPARNRFPDEAEEPRRAAA